MTDDEFYERQAAGLPVPAALDLLWEQYRSLGAAQPADFEAFLVAEVERLTKERDEAQSIATKWFGAGAGSSRWSDQTIDLWYAHQKVIKSWVALPGEGGTTEGQANGWL